MKTNLTHFTSFLMLMFLSISVHSQELQNALTETQRLQLNNNFNQPDERSFIIDEPAQQQLVTCTPDTVEYPLFKATGLQGLSLNNATSAYAGSQYYDAPQPITIHGIEFYAWSILQSPDVNTIIPVTCEIYLAGPDSIPTGMALASVVVQVDTTFGDGSLDALRKSGEFNAPIVVSDPYVVVISNNSPDGMGVVCNGYNAGPPDGALEWLASVNLFGLWSRSYNINVGGFTFDADWLFHPIVSYELEADFTFMETGLNVDFTNNVSPVINNRMYNQAAALVMTDFSHEWDFGDMSLPVNMENTSHLYASSGPYDVTLTETIFGWRRDCSDMEVMQVLVPVADIAISKTDDQDETYSGTTSTYTIVVTNNGPDDDPMVAVTDIMPMGLIVEYTSTSLGGATGNTTIGSGDINDIISMPAGSSVTYVVDAFIEVETMGTITNTAVATGSFDPDLNNDSMTDETFILGVIPTMGQWGIIILSFLLCIIGIISVKYKVQQFT